MNRNAKIIKISVIGIVFNIILVLFKAFVGFLANSIAIILDALNNFSDTLSALITIIGTKLASKKPDKEHPFGHGRIEYITAIVISIIVLIAGFVSLKESIEKIINPVIANYSSGTLVVIIASIISKYIFGSFVKNKGKELRSNSLIATGIDAIGDAVLSFSTLIAALISLIWHISLEGYIGVLISIIILRSAYKILKKTLGNMIGVRADVELTKTIKDKINSFDAVQGVYDLVLHNYGPNKIIGTAHLEVKDDMTAKEIHWLTRNINQALYKEFGIVMTLGIYASNDEEEVVEIKNYLQELVKEYPNVIQIHGFYVDDNIKVISADIVFNFNESSPKKVIKKIKSRLNYKFPEYRYNFLIDIDYSD